MISYSDHIAAVRLQVHSDDAHGLVAKLRKFGSLFIGEMASVVCSDKCSGTNIRYPRWRQVATLAGSGWALTSR